MNFHNSNADGIDIVDVDPVDDREEVGILAVSKTRYVSDSVPCSSTEEVLDHIGEGKEKKVKKGRKQRTWYQRSGLERTGHKSSSSTSDQEKVCTYPL